MIKRLGLLAGVLLALVGCSSKGNYEHATRFHEDGRAKPIVAFVPVFDRSGSNVGWSLSEEFTHSLKSRFLKRSNFYVSTSNEINSAIATLSAENNPFGAETNWIKESFENHEYVVFAELVEHDIHPKELKGNFLDKITPSSELTVTMRIRVFDLRGSKPQVILQEFVRQSHVIPKPSDLTEHSPERWKKIIYAVSPMGLAHAQLAKEVVKRIEDYILLSKSK
jgi:hypothetical protein